MARNKRVKSSNVIIVAIVTVLVLIAVYNAVRIGSGSHKKPNTVSTAASDVEYPLAVYFVDVGEGDGAVVRCGQTVLVIDGGEREAADAMLDFLASIGVDAVDCYIASHPHSDHIGAAAAIIGQLKVKNVMMTAFSEINIPTTSTYERLLTAIENNGCDVIFPSAGETYTFGELKLFIAGPVAESSEYNNMSLVIKVTYGKTSFLFTGDVEKDGEDLILQQGYDISADVLKVSHHGSSSSTTEPFLDTVSPRLAVISCGKNNDYGHPHRELLSLLSDHNVQVLRTDLNGTVTVFSDGKDIFVK